jgi:hypothetical protein
MSIPSLLGSYIDETYQRLVQTQGGEFADGLGNPITFGSTFPFIGNAVITGSLIMTGSHNGQSGITSSLFGTSSWAYNSITASYIDGGTF